ncbi:MAG: hypothetical protein ACOC4Z_01190 [Patescibacteria group bacterium]
MSSQAILREMIEQGHGLPDYINRVGRTEAQTKKSEPLSGKAGEAGHVRETRTWTEEYRVTGYSSVHHQPYARALVRVVWEGKWEYGNRQPPASIVKVELVGLQPDKFEPYASSFEPSFEEPSSLEKEEPFVVVDDESEEVLWDFD